MSTKTFTVDDQGVHDPQTDIILCPQAIKVVQYSKLDDTLYVQWPTDGNFHHMATIPMSVVNSADAKTFQTRCNAIGLTIRDGQEARIQEYLKQAAEPFLAQTA